MGVGWVGWFRVVVKQAQYTDGANRIELRKTHVIPQN